MNVRMLIELAAVGMQGHKQAYFDIELFGPFQQGIGGTSEEFVEQGASCWQRRARVYRAW